ncbi:hypothetical protein [Helicobacter bizzozeronii]|uniref:hypothetical protein n=1 Tax=Helicobacter bizzozeronii TaxID=56877 RepID=UPI000CF0EA0F|nr:hypothetical protein [Helicobacter bizzozeronii]
MAGFLIVYENHKIGAGEFKPEGFEALTRHNSLWQDFKPYFWEWLAEKARLEPNQAHAFVILSDQTLEIPSHLSIAPHFDLKLEGLNQALAYFFARTIPAHLQLHTHPASLALDRNALEIPKDNKGEKIPDHRCGPLILLARKLRANKENP